MNAAEQKGGKEYCKDYQHYIKQCQHFNWQTSCRGANIQIHRHGRDFVRPLKQNEHLILLKHCYD